jgi:hypothetical protein
VGFEPVKALMVKETEEHKESRLRYYGGLREKEFLDMDEKTVILYFN